MQIPTTPLAAATAPRALLTSSNGSLTFVRAARDGANTGRPMVVQQQPWTLWAEVGRVWEQSERLGFGGHRTGVRTRAGSGPAGLATSQGHRNKHGLTVVGFFFQFSFNLHAIKYTNHKYTV